MIPHRLTRISIFAIFKFILFLITYIISEISDSYYPNLTQSILQNATLIDPYNMTNITGYVYFSIKGAQYPHIFDDYFNFSIYGAAAKRVVQYCQYQRAESSAELFALSNIETYPKRWVSQYINSTNFLDKNYINPPLKIIVNETNLYNNMRIGNLTIPSEFYPSDLLFYYLEPNETRIVNFSYSKASTDFEFIRNGYFYHSVTNKSSIRQINKIQNEIRFKKLNDEDLYYESQKIFFERCHSGDVRIIFLLYAPLNVTYFGYVENFTLKAKIVDKDLFGANKMSLDDKKILFGQARLGTTKRGDLSKWPLKTLVSHCTPENDIITYILFFPRICIIYTVFRYCIVLLFTPFRNPLRSSYWIVALSFLNFAFRSMIWNIWYLNFKIWLSLFIIHLSAGYIAGVWSISFLSHQQTANQNTDNQNQQNRNEGN